MSTTFTPAARGAIPLLIGLEGASGSGKTKSSLEILHGIGEAIREMHGREPKLAVVDTENRRALIYADDYNFSHVDMQPPFSPLAFGKILEDAEKAGFDAIMFDSFSHEWSGEGGVKEWAERIEAGVPKAGIANPRTPKDSWEWWKDWQVKPVTGPGAWAEPKSTLRGGHKWLINQMLRSKMHVIISLRSTSALKMDQVPIMENGEPKLYTSGKNQGKVMKETVVVAPADLPLLERWTPDCEKNLPYEMTTSMLFVPDKAGVPHVRKRIGTAGAPAIDETRQMNSAWGKALALWAEGKGAKPAEKPDYTDLIQLLEKAASGGTSHLSKAWTQTLTPTERKDLANELPRLKDLATAADPPPQQEPEPEQQQHQPQTGGYDGV